MTADSRPFCQICQSTIEVTQLGVDACRACASFFKRTILSGKKFTCRQGNGSCVISKDAAVKCKQCRFERCRLLGMTEERWNRKGKQCNFNIENPSTSIGQTILERIANEYRDCCDRRRDAENAIREAKYKLNRIPHPHKELYHAEWKFTLEALRILTEEMTLFIRRTFPSFDTLSIEDQETLIKCFVGTYSIIDPLYMTISNFNCFTRYFMASMTTCYSQGIYTHFLNQVEEIKMKKEFSESLLYYAKMMCTLTWSSIRKSELTDTEFQAILALGLWDFGDEMSLPDHLTQMGDDIRQEIFTDLHRYYKNELGLDDYSIRMGNMMSVSHAMKEAKTVMAEGRKIHMKVFDLYKSNDYVNKLVMDA